MLPCMYGVCDALYLPLEAGITVPASTGKALSREEPGAEKPV